MAAVAACRRFPKRAPGERIYIGLFSPDRKQSAVDLSYAKGLFHSSPALESEIVTEGKEFIELRDDIVIERNVRTGFFERELFKSVRAHLPEHLRAVITFCYITGWRIISEVLPLQCRQVDQRARTVSLDPHTTKNDEARVFAYGAITELRDLLTAQVQSAERLSRETEQIVSHVFHKPDGSPINQSRFRDAWPAATVAAGCPGRIPQDFRRTAVRNLVRAGVPERVAMTMTGHKTRSVFERYNITSGSDLNDAAAKLDAYLTARPEQPTAGKVRPFKRRAK